MLRTLTLACAVTLFSFLAFSQNPVPTGAPPFSTVSNGIDLANLNVHLQIPIFHKAGRGAAPFNYDITYDSSIWYPVPSGSTKVWNAVPNWGWGGGLQGASLSGYVTSNITNFLCYPLSGPPNPIGGGTSVSNYVYHDAYGVAHPFTGEYYMYGGQTPSTCSNYQIVTNFTSTATDGSGLTLIVSNNSGTGQVVMKNGTVVTPPYTPTAFSTTGITDANGNYAGSDANGNFTDTIGGTSPHVLSISGTAPNPVYFITPIPAGGTTQIGGSGNPPPPITVTYAPYTIEPPQGCPTVSYTPTAVSLVDKITYPDGTYYHFTYEVVSGTYTTGRIASVKLPTGGQITYSYTGGTNGIVCGDGSTAGLTITTPDGQWTYTRTQGSGAAWTTVVRDPQGNETRYQFQGLYETKREVYQGLTSGGNLLETVDTCYNQTSGPPDDCTSLPISGAFGRLDVTTRFPSKATGASARTTTLFDSPYQRPYEVDETDFGSIGGSVGSLLRKTTTSYGSWNGSSCTALGNYISSAVCQVTVTDGGGNTISKASYTYDEGTPAASGAPHLNSVSGSRGNPTTITVQSGPSAALTTRISYFDTGNPNVVTDPSGATTTYTYTCGSSYANSTSLAASGLANLTTSAVWDCNGGVPTQTKDPNQQATNYKYTDGSSSDQYSWRLKETDFPDGGVQTSVLTTSSSPSNPWTITNAQKVDSTQTTSTESSLDGLGRVYKTLNTSLTPSTEIDTGYDADGRVDSVSNPYVSPSDPTYGTTHYDYDALGRQTVVTNAGGMTSTVSYGAGTVTYGDEGRNFSGQRIQRAVQYDGIGRIKSVCEITAGISWNGDSGIGGCSTTLGGTGFTTSYIYDYDAAHSFQRTTVNQGSMSSRVYEYDWLGRLTSETNPEMTATGGTTGTVTYSYNSAGDLYQRTRPKQNQSSASVNVITTYAYDAYHRPTQVSYDDGTTPTLSYYYDETWGWGQTIPNGKGRLTSEYAGSSGGAAAVFDYDPMGRIISRHQCTPSTCGFTYLAVNYGYNLAGDVTSTSNGISNITFGYTYDAAQHLTQVTSNLADSYHPGTLASSLSYNPLGQLASGSYGNGVSLSRTYDNMGRLVSLSDIKSSTTIHSITGPGTNNTVTYFPNSDMSQAVDSVNGAWTYQYDDLNRLALASGPGAALNILLNSEQIDQTPWAATRASVLANDSTTTDPNGHTTAERITATQASGVVYQLLPSEIVVSGSKYTFSVWLKAPSSTQVALGTARCSGYDMETTTVMVGTSWQRFSFTDDGMWTSNCAVEVVVYVITQGQYVWMWGAQLERGNSEGPYVATTSSQQTNGYTYDYDRYGNRWHQNLDGTASPSYSFDANNHIQGSGVVYDAMGNITSDGIGGTYIYDAEERLVSGTFNGTSFSFQYDADGNRVKTVVNGAGQDFIYDLSHHHLAVISSSTWSWNLGEVYAGNWHLATYVNGDTYFAHADWLGTMRVRTDHTGAVSQSYTSLPFGDSLSSLGLDWAHFTDQDRDADTTGLDHFLFRQYSSVQGRWMTPDPAGLAAADLSNPQTWNRYAYVMNNPMAMIDPLGLDGCTYAGWLPFGATPCDEKPISVPANCGDSGCHTVPQYLTVTPDDSNPNYDASNHDPTCPVGYVCITVPTGPTGPNGGGGGGGNGGGGASFSFTNLLNLDKCIEKNASTYSVGGLINLAANTDVRVSSILGSNSVTGTALLLTGQDGFLPTAWNSVKLGYKAATGTVFGATLNPQIMSNGPNSFRTLVTRSGSPQPVLGDGTNYHVSFLGKAGKLLGAAKGIADVALSGALVTNCLLGQIQ